MSDLHAQAIADPGLYRHLMFWPQDQRRAKALGRPLRPAEVQSNLPWPQRRIIDRVERAVAERSGEVLTVLMARQSGKNETAAVLQCRALSAHRGIPGSVWIRTAPTFKPQIVNSKRRLERMLAVDPFIKGRWRPRDGYIYECGQAEVQFLSSGASANVVGATASLCLDVDEAHKVDAGKFEEDLMPFTASTNAPTVLWGVAADGNDLLHEYRQLNEGTDRLLLFPAEIWCELNPAYAAHYEGRVAKLGKTHPVLMTQYDLKPIDAVGGYLNASQRANLFSGDHPRLEQPRDGMLYGLVIDVGGESELDLTDERVRSEEPGRDYTMAWVLEWDPAATFDPHPLVRVVDGVWWTGRPHTAMIPDVIAYARRWRVSRGVVDARGVGEALAKAVNRALPVIEPYAGTAKTVSEDCFDLLARLNTNTVRMWKADPVDDAEYAELLAEARHTLYEISAHDNMRLAKPTGRGASGKHIDGVKALTYLHHAVEPPGAGSGTEEEEVPRGRFNPFEGGRGRLG